MVLTVVLPEPTFACDQHFLNMYTIIANTCFHNNNNIIIMSMRNNEGALVPMHPFFLKSESCTKPSLDSLLDNVVTAYAFGNIRNEIVSTRVHNAGLLVSITAQKYP